MTQLDIFILKKLSNIVNIIPIIAKSDSLTLLERRTLKENYKQEIKKHDIKCYPFDHEYSTNTKLNEEIREMIPFAVVASEKNEIIMGKTVPARKTQWGIINIEDENHCEFINLRNFILRQNLFDLIDTTANIHYESFRTRQLLALKESTLLQN